MDWSSFLGPVLQLGGSIYGANRTANTAKDYSAIGAPYRERLNAITADPNAYYNSPEASALANASDRRYSASFGNPAGSGTAIESSRDAMMRGYGAERDRLFNYGGGAYFNRAAPGAQGNATNAGMGVFNSLVPFGQLFGGGGGMGGLFGGGGSAPIGNLLNDPNYMSGGGMGFE